MRALKIDSIRRHALVIVLAGAALFAAAPAMAVCGNSVVEAGEDCDDGGSNGSFNSCCNTSCFFTGKTPDVIVGDLTGISRYGEVGGITAYSVGTTSCNLGSCWLKWISNNAEHPVIGQNLYRLRNGRFEQMGQSWLKHGFTAVQGTTCSSQCNPSGTGARLGVNCSDPYGSGLNGTQTNLGPKQDVNPDTGVYPYPDSRIGLSGDVIFKRLQVHNSDIDVTPTSTLYFIEGQYVTRDDAAARNQNNNASYRPASFTVSGIPAAYQLSLSGSTVRQKAGIQAWKATDPTVTETMWDVSEGRFILSAKATALGGGVYHYEYALQNLNNNRGAQAFSVPLPPGTTVTNVEFHDVDYHSGVPFSGTDWTPTVTATSVTWSTETFAVNPFANALRWGTLYNFRFDADIAPGASPVMMTLFKPGGPGRFNTTPTVTPGPCGGAPDGTVCDDRNACTQTDSCQAGACTSNPVVCPPSDQCHGVGTCDPSTGQCSNPVVPDMYPCDDGDLCTLIDACVTGYCVPIDAVTCTATDECHNVGTCDPLTGQCSNPPKAEGASCDDGNDCTTDDVCSAGTCAGNGLPGDIGDGVRLDQLDGVTVLTWALAPNSTSSAILRGLMSHLPVGPGGDDEVCFSDIDGNAYTDADIPPENDSFWYLIQGRTSCGGGPYGSEFTNGLGSQRVSTTCP